MKVVYTDGACTGNGKSHAVAAYAILVDKKVYCGKLRPFTYVYENMRLKCTDTVVPVSNNRAEMFAVIIACIVLKDNFHIVTDSSYCINVINKWMHNWKDMNYFGTDKKKNLDLVEILYTLLLDKKYQISFQPSHVKNPKTENELGNFIVDREATSAIKFEDFKLRVFTI